MPLPTKIWAVVVVVVKSRKLFIDTGLTFKFGLAFANGEFEGDT